jgi:hypothetical protein
MAYRNSPKIVTDGLVFCVDASNRKSYVGSGASWNDMIRNVNGAMTNIIFTVPNIMAFNGSNSTCNYGTNYLVTNDFTITFWCRPTATRASTIESNSGISGTSAQRYVVESYNTGDSNCGAGVSVGTNGISVFEHAPVHMPSPLVWDSTVSSTAFTNVTVTYTSKQPALYVNGVLVRTGLTSGRANVYVVLGRLGDSGSSYGLYAGDLNSVYIYSRTLSPSEIVQNFNVMRGKLGV